MIPSFFLSVRHVEPGQQLRYCTLKLKSHLNYFQVAARPSRFIPPGHCINPEPINRTFNSNTDNSYQPVQEKSISFWQTAQNLRFVSRKAHRLILLQAFNA